MDLVGSYGMSVEVAYALEVEIEERRYDILLVMQ